LACETVPAEELRQSRVTESRANSASGARPFPSPVTGRKGERMSEKRTVSLEIMKEVFRVKNDGKLARLRSI